MQNHEEQNAIDFTTILKGLEEKWVVISEDLSKVLGSYEYDEEVDEKTLNKGYLMLVPPQGHTFHLPFNHNSKIFSLSSSKEFTSALSAPSQSKVSSWYICISLFFPC